MEPLARVLLAIAGLLGAFIFLQIATCSRPPGRPTASWPQPRVPRWASRPPCRRQQIQSAVEGLKKNNLFAPPATKQCPVNEVIGILGNQALINGQWYKVGDTVADAKILAIEPTKVKVVWNGQEKEFTPIGSTGGGGPEGPRQGPRGRPPTPPGAPMVVTGGAPSGGATAGPSPGGTRPAQGLRERWKDMSPEERQKYRDEMRERLSRREPVIGSRTKGQLHEAHEHRSLGHHRRGDTCRRVCGWAAGAACPDAGRAARIRGGHADRESRDAQGEGRTAVARRRICQRRRC